MKFLKLRLHNVPNQGTIESWRLIIDNEEDLLKFHNIDVERYMHDFLNMDKGRHTAGNTRESVIESWMHTRIATTPADTKVYPIVEIAHLLDRKAHGMYKTMKHGPLCVNEVGGYCNLDSFIKTWNAEVIEELNKSDIGFPIETEALNIEVLVLENGDKIGYETSKYLKAKNISKYGVIGHLKERDMRHVFQSIANASTIIIESQFLDDSQNNTFIKAFLALDKKNIVIFAYDNSIGRLTGNDLFAKANELHNITINPQ